MASKPTKRVKADEKDNIFMVEKVLDKRIGKAGREEFLIQWLGFAPSDSSWEPRENLQCVDMLAEFEKEYAKKEKPSRRKPKSPEHQKQPSTSDQMEEESNMRDPFALSGKQLKCIVGLTKAPGDLHFLCKFADDTACLIPAKEVNSRYRPFVNEYGNFLRRQMEKRQKRIEDGRKRTIEVDDDSDDWPDFPEGYDITGPKSVPIQSREPSGNSESFEHRPETPTTSLILHDMQMGSNYNSLTTFPSDPIDESGTVDSFVSVFDDSSNSSPPRCSIVVDTIPNDDDLFPGTSGIL